MQPARRYVMIGLGLVCVGLAVIGAFVPVVPTTPLLLLAAFLFGRSSPRLYRWLHENRWFGAALRDYRAGRGLPPREKALTIVLLWITMGVSSAYAVSSWWARGTLVAIAVAVTVHLLRTPTRRAAPPATRRETR